MIVFLIFCDVDTQLIDAKRTRKGYKSEGIVLIDNSCSHNPAGAVIRFHGIIVRPTAVHGKKYDTIQNDDRRDIDCENVRIGARGIANDPLVRV